jgi:predicted dehydrogenase
MTLVKETRVLMVGPGGHGRWHLKNIHELRDRGFRLVGVYHPHPEEVDRDELVADVPIHDDLGRLLRTTTPEITIVCTPIHTHVSLALQALQYGSAVLLEKPPAPTLAEFEALLAGAVGGVCQVGFQGLGSAAIGAARQALAQGVIGELKGIGGAGTWIRDEHYFHRSPWAGHRYVDGVPVMDGALTNPFAHAVATALQLVGNAEASIELADIELDMYRAHDIESDDTSSVRLTTANGTVISVAATLCPEVDREPYLVVHGTEGNMTLWYTQDTLTVRDALRERTCHYPRTSLLENLAAHLADRSIPLLAPLTSMGPFMQFAEAVATSPDPRVIPDSAIAVTGTGESRRLVVNGIDAAIERSVAGLALFRELGLSWTGTNAIPSPPMGPTS